MARQGKGIHIIDDTFRVIIDSPVDNQPYYQGATPTVSAHCDPNQNPIEYYWTHPGGTDQGENVQITIPQDCAPGAHSIKVRAVNSTTNEEANAEITIIVMEQQKGSGGNTGPQSPPPPGPQGPPGRDGRDGRDALGSGGGINAPDQVKNLQVDIILPNPNSHPDNYKLNEEIIVEAHCTGGTPEYHFNWRVGKHNLTHGNKVPIYLTEDKFSVGANTIVVQVTDSNGTMVNNNVTIHIEGGNGTTTPKKPDTQEGGLQVEITRLTTGHDGRGANILQQIRRNRGEDKTLFSVGTKLLVTQDFFHWNGKMEYRVTLARYTLKDKKWEQIKPIPIDRNTIEITEQSHSISQKIVLEEEGILYRYIIEAWPQKYDRVRDSHLYVRDHIDLYTKQPKEGTLPPNVWVDLDESARKHRIPVSNEKPRIKYGLNKNFEKGSKNYATVTNGDARIKQNFEINNRKPCGVAKYFIRCNAIEVSKELFVKPYLDLSDLKGRELNPPFNIVCTCEGFAKHAFQSSIHTNVFKAFSISPGKSQVASMRFNVPENFCTDKERYIFFVVEVRDEQDDHIQHLVDFNYRRIIVHPDNAARSNQEALKSISNNIPEEIIKGVFKGLIKPGMDTQGVLLEIMKTPRAKENLTSDKAFWIKDWGIDKKELKKLR